MEMKEEVAGLVELDGSLNDSVIAFESLIPFIQLSSILIHMKRLITENCSILAKYAKVHIGQMKRLFTNCAFIICNRKIKEFKITYSLSFVFIQSKNLLRKIYQITLFRCDLIIDSMHLFVNISVN